MYIAVKTKKCIRKVFREELMQPPAAGQLINYWIRKAYPEILIQPAGLWAAVPNLDQASDLCINGTYPAGLIRSASSRGLIN